jgi:hypothetical protein
MVVAMLALGGCATQAQQEMSRMKQVGDEARGPVNDCWARLAASPQYQALKDKMGGDSPSLAMKTSEQKATPEEASQVLSMHQDYIAPCRKLSLEAAAKINPGFVSVLAKSYARADANYAQFVTRKITWGEFVTENQAVFAQRQSDLAAVGQAIQHNLEQSHGVEVARRQQAAAALSSWAYQQQVLLQNQQMINAMNQPRMTNCQYVGTYLNCTTF